MDLMIANSSAINPTRCGAVVVTEPAGGMKLHGSTKVNMHGVVNDEGMKMTWVMR